MQILKKTRDKLFKIIENTLKNDPDQMTEEEKDYIDALIIAWGTIGMVIDLSELRDPPSGLRERVFRDIHERIINSRGDKK